MFPSSDERKDIPTLLGPLKRPNPNHWTQLNGYIFPEDPVILETELCITTEGRYLKRHSCIYFIRSVMCHHRLSNLYVKKIVQPGGSIRVIAYYYYGSTVLC
jgi:hypothetical protein